jgi:hypothetical protein
MILFDEEMSWSIRAVWRPMPAAPPVINVTPFVGPFRSDREMLNAFGDAIVEVRARTWFGVSWCDVMRREYVVEEQPRLLRLEDVRGEDVPNMGHRSNLTSSCRERIN